MDPSGIELAPGIRVAPDAITFSYSPSRGPGGQNVNKVATRADLRIALAAIPIHEEARARLVALAGRRITDAGELIISADEHRSQSRNRDECFDRLRDLIVRAMVRPKPRKRTRPSRGSVERRLESKRVRSRTKHRRRSTE